MSTASSQSSRAEELARACLAELEQASVDDLARLARGLSLADPHVRSLGRAVQQFSFDRDRDEPPGFLAVLLMRGAIREAALWPSELRERLEEAEEPFWVTVREAAEELMSRE